MTKVNEATKTIPSKRCAICGKSIPDLDSGCSPSPLISKSHAVCCDDCYQNFVIPARLKANNTDQFMTNEVNTLYRLSEEDYTEDELEQAENTGCLVPTLYFGPFSELQEVHDLLTDECGYVAEMEFMDLPMSVNTLKHEIELGTGVGRRLIVSEEVSDMLEEMLDDCTMRFWS